MGLSTDISLSREAKPIFPNICVYSGEKFPDSHITVYAPTSTWFFWLSMIFGNRVKIKAPIKREYRLRFYFNYYGRWIIVLVLGMIALNFLYPLVGDLGPARKYVAMALVLLVLSPVFIWGVFFPPHFDINVSIDSIEYLFKDSLYAREFAILNKDQIVLES